MDDCLFVLTRDDWMKVYNYMIQKGEELHEKKIYISEDCEWESDRWLWGSETASLKCSKKREGNCMTIKFWAQWYNACFVFLHEHQFQRGKYSKV